MAERSPPRLDLREPRWRGAWAVVTGASSGIGHEFSRQLAAHGLNLVLVARRQDRLFTLAETLTQTHGVSCRPMVCDLADPDAPKRMRAYIEAEGIVPRLLVNNAAFGRWGRVESHPPAVYRAMLQTDLAAPVLLSLELFPLLRRETPAGIVMVSSPAALQPMPYMAVYGAAKVGLHHVAQALHEEWRSQGILVQTLVPGPTATEFDTVAGAYSSAISGRGKVGEVVLASIEGLKRGDVIVWQARGTWRQRLLGLLPPRWGLRIVASMFKPPEQVG